MVNEIKEIRWANELPSREDINTVISAHIHNGNAKFTMRSYHGDKLFIKDAVKYDIDRVIQLLANYGVTGTIEYMDNPISLQLPQDKFIRLKQTKNFILGGVEFINLRDALIEHGVKSLKEYGYSNASKNNILDNTLYRMFFLEVLQTNKGQTGLADLVISELESEIEKSRNEEYSY